MCKYSMSADIRIVEMSKLQIESVGSLYEGLAHIMLIKSKLCSPTYYITF
jgi:hypothetical protein